MNKCSPYPILERFSHVNISKCENSPGIYGFWFQKKCIYIGKAEKQGLRDRLYQHWTKSHNEYLRAWIESKKNKLMFCWKIVSINNINEAEKFFIYKFQPLTNILLVGRKYPLSNCQNGDSNGFSYTCKKR